MVSTPKYDLDTDTTLGGNNASDYVSPSQKAIKAYVDNHSSGAVNSVNGQTGAVVLTASDVGAVDLTSDQSISGEKTFTSNATINKSSPNLYLKNTGLTKGTNPSSAIDMGLRFRDTDGATVGNIVHMVDASGNCLSKIESYKQTANSSAAASMTVRYNKDGGAGVQFFTSSSESGDTNLSQTTVSSSTTENYIPTMGWVNNPATSTNVVHRSDDETIGGVKTLTDDAVRQSSNISADAGGYIIKNTAVDTTTTPTSATYHYLRCRDKNDNLLGDIRFVRGTDGSQLTQIVARTGISGSEVSASFGVVSGADGAGSINGSRTVLRSIGNLGRPSSTDYSAVTVKSSGSSYTAPNTGYIYVSLSRSAASWALTLQANNISTKGTTNTNNNTNNVAAWLPVKKGDSYTVSYSGQDSISIRFVSAVLEE